MGRDLGGPGGADARGRAAQPDRHRPPRAPPRGDGPPAPQGRPRRRGLRLPPGQPALPHLRERDPDGGPRRPQPLLVPALPGPGRFVRGLTRVPVPAQNPCGSHGSTCHENAEETSSTAPGRTSRTRPAAASEVNDTPPR
ncbi:protein of unknown function [Streptomyces sp. KY75]|nr:protein of unknown function [Streptomyces sp. KY75]CAD5985748.1 protein of unknown function [Streptomyces sp. KY70]